MSIQELQTPKPDFGIVGGAFYITLEAYCRLSPLVFEDEVREYLASQGFNTQELNNESHMATCFHFWPIVKERDYAARSLQLRLNCKRITVRDYAERARRLRTKGKRNTARKYCKLSLSTVRKYLRASLSIQFQESAIAVA